MKEDVWYLIKIALLSVVVLLLASCKSVQYVPIETTHTEYIEKVVVDSSEISRLRYLVDSVRQSVTIVYKDCTIMVVDTAGNVKSKERYKDTTKDRLVEHKTKEIDSTAFYRSIIDSLRHIKNDTIQKPYPVEKELTKWQQFKVEYGGYMLFIILVTIIYLIWWSKRKDKLTI